MSPVANVCPFANNTLISRLIRFRTFATLVWIDYKFQLLHGLNTVCNNQADQAASRRCECWGGHNHPYCSSGIALITRYSVGLRGNSYERMPRFFNLVYSRKLFGGTQSIICLPHLRSLRFYSDSLSGLTDSALGKSVCDCPVPTAPTTRS